MSCPFSKPPCPINQAHWGLPDRLVPVHGWERFVRRSGLFFRPGAGSRGDDCERCGAGTTLCVSGRRARDGQVDTAHAAQAPLPREPHRSSPLLHSLFFQFPEACEEPLDGQACHRCHLARTRVVFSYPLYHYSSMARWHLPKALFVFDMIASQISSAAWFAALGR